MPTRGAQRCPASSLIAHREEEDPMSDTPRPAPLLVEYINFRGETALRRIMPGNEAPRFGTTEHHTSPTWLLDGLDVDRGVQRTWDMGAMFPVHPSGLARLDVIERLDGALGALLDVIASPDSEFPADLREAVNNAIAVRQDIKREPIHDARRAAAASQESNSNG